VAGMTSVIGGDAGATHRASCPTGKSTGKPARPFSMSSPPNKNILIFRNRKSVYIQRHPALTRGALRGRHGRWERDAVDATVSVHGSVRANDIEADGEVVWS
jgi:hypothetical protein